MRKLFVFSIAILCLHSIVLTGCEQSAVMTSTPLVASRQVSFSNLDLIEQWRVTVGRNSYVDSPPPLLLANGKAILTSQDEKSHGTWLIAFSRSDGQAIWKTLIQPDDDPCTYIEDSLHDMESLYVICSGYVIAYRLEDGQFLWQTPHLGGHVSYNFHAWDDDVPLKVYTSRHEVISIARGSGEVLSREPYPYLMQYGAYDFSYEWETRKFSVTSRKSNVVLWQRQIPWIGYMNTQFIDDTIMFLDVLVYFQMYRMDLASGSIVWQTPGFSYISNYALSDARVYAIRQHGELVALDVETGQEIGEIVFGQISPMKLGEYPYWVAAEDGYVLAYFGDSQELIALKRE